MSASERKDYASNLATLIAAALLVAAWLGENDALDGAGRFLAFAAALIAIFWNLTGRIDE